MFDLFKRKKPTPTLAEIARLTIGRTALIDPLALRLLPEDSLVTVPSPTLPIVAQGKADMGEGVFLHRFYPDEDSVLLQILGGDGINDHSVSEITLFTVHECFYPSDDGDWNGWRERMRQTRFAIPSGGPLFERVWFGNSERPEDPVSFWETVYDDRKAESGRRIFQTCMLFVRRIGEVDEFLLVNQEEPEQGDRCVSLLVGMSLSANEISV